MRTRYKLIIKIDDFILYETVYTFEEEVLGTMLDDAHDPYKYKPSRDIDTDCLERLIPREDWEKAWKEHGDGYRYKIDYVSKYPEFLIASIISQKIYTYGIFSNFHEMSGLFDGEGATEETSTNNSEGYGWECFPID